MGRSVCAEVARGGVEMTEAQRKWQRCYRANHPGVRCEESRLYREKHREEVAKYQHCYYLAHREDLRECGRETRKRWQAAHPDWQREYDRQGRAQKLPQLACRDYVNKGVRRGHIIKPTYCTECVSKTPSRLLHAHHPDYSKPYEFMWLCKTCHGNHHRKYPDVAVSTFVQESELETGAAA
jgi:hypothetical protein